MNLNVISLIWGKTFATAREAAEGFDSFSHYVEKQSKPKNFKGTPKKIDWPEMPSRKAGGAAAIAAQLAARRVVGKKQIKKRKKWMKLTH